MHALTPKARIASPTAHIIMPGTAAGEKTFPDNHTIAPTAKTPAQLGYPL